MIQYNNSWELPIPCTVQLFQINAFTIADVSKVRVAPIDQLVLNQSRASLVHELWGVGQVWWIGTRSFVLDCVGSQLHVLKPVFIPSPVWFVVGLAPPNRGPLELNGVPHQDQTFWSPDTPWTPPHSCDGRLPSSYEATHSSWLCCEDLTTSNPPSSEDGAPESMRLKHLYAVRAGYAA